METTWYSGNLNTEIVRYSNGKMCPILKRSVNGMASEYQTIKFQDRDDHLNIGLLIVKHKHPCPIQSSVLSLVHHLA